jgi:gamma-glutamyltranspeptidase / glutathione hydrolase
VACTQPVAAAFGREILEAGGNAVDACVAIASGMQLMEPCSTGLGGDCFLLYYEAASGRVFAMNGSGRAPAALTLDRARADADAAAPPSSSPPSSLPPYHPHTITVPGAAAGWCDAVSRWGSGADRMPLSRILAPAIRAAREGAPISPLTAHHWGEGAHQLLQWRANHPGAKDAPEDLLVREEVGGALRAPRAGEVFRNPALAGTFESLARDGADAGFYRGAAGRAIVEAVQSVGGLLSLDDLAAHTTTYPDAISVDLCGVRVWEVPPNGQGIVALMAASNVRETLLRFLREAEGAEGGRVAAAAARLGVLNGSSGVGTGAAAPAAVPSPSPPSPPSPLAWAGLDLLSALPQLTSDDLDCVSLLRALGHNSPAYTHLLIEALRHAFADARASVCDTDVEGEGSGSPSPSPSSPSSPDGVLASGGDPARPQPASVAAMLDPALARARAAAFDPTRAVADATAGAALSSSDTVSFSATDRFGNSCSFINSNYMGFGSGLVPAGCGFSLQNRGANFSLVPGHPNALAPRKRPYHTIIPALLTDRSGGLLATYSNMGGFMQPQGHLQLLLNLVAFGADPQTALDAPRICIADGEGNGRVSFEEGFDEEGTVRVLEREAGHRVARAGEGAAAAAAASLVVRGWGRSLFGRGQILLTHPRTGVIWAGSDGRGDGCALAARG